MAKANNIPTTPVRNFSNEIAEQNKAIIGQQVEGLTTIQFPSDLLQSFGLGSSKRGASAVEGGKAYVELSLLDEQGAYVRFVRAACSELIQLNRSKINGYMEAKPNDLFHVQVSAMTVSGGAGTREKRTDEQILANIAELTAGLKQLPDNAVFATIRKDTEGRIEALQRVLKGRKASAVKAIAEAAIQA